MNRILADEAAANRKHGSRIKHAWDKSTSTISGWAKSAGAWFSGAVTTIENVCKEVASFVAGLKNSSNATIAGLTMAVEDAGELVGGVIQGVLMSAIGTDVEDCVSGMTSFISLTEQLCANLKAGAIGSAFKTLGSIITDVKNTESSCEAIQDDVEKLEKFAELCADPDALAASMVGNITKNIKDICTDLVNAINDLINATFDTAGEQIGDATYLVLVG